MANVNRFKIWLNIHQAVALFFLPLVLIYVLTGVLDILGYDRPPAVLEAELAWPAAEDRAGRERRLRNFLRDRGLRVMEGSIRHYQRLIFWGPRTGRHLGVYQNPEKEMAKVRLFEPNCYYRLLALHKGQGGAVFQCFIFLFGLVYAGVYLSGLLLVFQKYRSRVLWPLAGGTVTALVFFGLG